MEEEDLELRHGDLPGLQPDQKCQCQKIDGDTLVKLAIIGLFAAAILTGKASFGEFWWLLFLFAL